MHGQVNGAEQRRIPQHTLRVQGPPRKSMHRKVGVKKSSSHGGNGLRKRRELLGLLNAYSGASLKRNEEIIQRCIPTIRTQRRIPTPKGRKKGKVQLPPMASPLSTKKTFEKFSIRQSTISRERALPTQNRKQSRKLSKLDTQ